MLSQRRQQVLTALIKEYVAKALPVASRTLVDHYQLGVSSATVRNELSHLEDDGYILQPHTSAGRVPTDFGYRSLVDNLLKDEKVQENDETTEALRQVRENARELDDLLEQTSDVLARLTDCLAIVLPPNALSLQVKRISLIVMEGHLVLMIVVTEEGQVLKRSIEFADSVVPEDIDKIEGLMNRVFAGKSFTAMRDEIDSDAVAAFQDPLARVMLSEMFALLQDGEGGHMHRLGLTTLMRQPEFSASQMLVPLVTRLEDDSLPVTILDATRDEDMVVRIGHENKDSALDNLSIVAARYGTGDDAGFVAVVGPTRLDYDKVIRAVRAAQRTLQGD
ncbi:MAG: heat-inducible transcriptional repressor HrcA [Eggerthellaceae bacterium]|jgi:heat-inducible transcriptional repressor